MWAMSILASAWISWAFTVKTHDPKYRSERPEAIPLFQLHERIEAIRRAFSERELCVDTTYAYYLHVLGKDYLADKLFVSWEKLLSKTKDLIDEEFLESNQRGCVLVISPYKKLQIDFDFIPNSIAVISLSEPFDEESFYLQSRLDRFLAEWKKVPAYNVHASGHGDVYEISKFIEKLNPNKIFVIHSNSPEVINNVISSRRGIFIPNYKEEFEIA